MKIAATQYCLNKRTLEIYFSGCNFRCEGCHNPELWDFNYGEEFDLKQMADIYDKLINADKLIDTISILGGEPLHQDRPLLYCFVNNLAESFPNKHIILYTGYSLEELQQSFPSVFNLFDEIKYGSYDKNKLVEGELLASSNQGIWRRTYE